MLGWNLGCVGVGSDVTRIDQVLEVTGEAKVAEFGAHICREAASVKVRSCREEDVEGLEVTEGESRGVQIGESVCDLAGESEAVLWRKGSEAGLFEVGEGGKQRASFHELSHELKAWAVGNDAEELDDAGVAQALESGGFAAEVDGSGARSRRRGGGG